MESGFRDVERRLDALLLAAMPSLTAAGIEVQDSSDRRGRECYSWTHRFDWTQGESPIRRVWVTVRYLDPWKHETTARVKVMSRVEVFRRGQPSDFVFDTEESLSLDELFASGLGEVVHRLMKAGHEILERDFDPALLAERARAQAAVLRDSDWEFYSKLGTERATVPCRATGCSRGAITMGYFCKAHTFELLRSRPCPFEPDGSG